MEISFNINDKFIATGSLFFERGYTFTAFFGLVFWNFTGGGGSYVRPPSPLLIPPILCNSEFNLDINIYAESKTLILWWLAGLLRVNEVMRSCWMNAIKNKTLYHFCRVESLLSYHKHRTKHNNTLKADAYIWWKVKVSKKYSWSYIFVRVVGLGGCGTLETLSKALILSKSPKYSKLDSLAYNCGMRVFAYINFSKLVLDTHLGTVLGTY